MRETDWVSLIVGLMLGVVLTLLTVIIAEKTKPPVQCVDGKLYRELTPTIYVRSNDACVVVAEE